MTDPERSGVTGLYWTATIWGGALIVLHSLRHRYRAVEGLVSRETIALLTALLGTYSIVGGSDVEEILREPVVLERLVRGGLSTLALALSLPILVRRLLQPRRENRALFGLGVYMGIALLSTTYSAAGIVTAAKVFELTAGVVPVVAVALGPEPNRRLREMLMMVIGFQTLLLVVATLGFFLIPDTFAIIATRPGFVIEESLYTPWAHSNTIAAMGAVVAVFGLSYYLGSGREARLWLAASIVGLVSIVLSSGRQGVVMAVVGVAIVLFAQRRRLFLWFLGPALAWLMVTFWDVIFSSLARNRPETFSTLTGRIFWWEAAIDVWTTHPWTGWGYSAGGRFVALTSIGNTGTSSLHSGYVEALVGVGIIGLIPLVYVLGRITRWSVHSILLRRDVAFAVLIVPLALRTSVSLGFGGWLNPEFVMFALLAALADRGSATMIPPIRRDVQTPVGSAP